MSLKLTVKPDEYLVVNGCVIKNRGNRAVISIENHADVLRGKDLLEPQDVKTPLQKAYYDIQTALIDARQREELVPKIQAALGKLAAVLGGYAQCLIFEAANNVSVGNFYLALKAVGKANKLESTAA
ncbi:flagellar biosynthesis repressor FlbT [Salipiger sp. PrR003]|uniref:flagellar biosynthesis repressor FlbT n=1 Tax=Salipiger sp. PrR003 TaxID=2706776 RepID=UPI0013DBB041|nr:flagellar biosynthesis repressor FlbT [Salipiger sp. PrR003]NDV50789.1 flagellum biosynthesis protein FlbT [Salipiger sp. PrR003]